MVGGATAYFESHPKRALAAIGVCHLALWTALPAIFYPNLPLDLIEALVYGREWQLGYDKLPPLPWWLVEVAHRLFDADVAYYALAQIAVLAALGLVYAVGVRVIGPLGALAGVLIVDGAHYFHYTAAKLNHDVVQLPFWALAGFGFHRGLRTGNQTAWIACGLALGLGVWAKYFVVVLAIPLALFLLFDRDARAALTTPGPWLAAAAALIVAAPHLAWLWLNDFLPLAYAERRAVLPRGLLDHLIHPVQFVVSQFGFLIPAFVIAAPLALMGRSSPGPDAFDRRILTLLALGPALTTLGLSLFTGRGLVAMWGYPLWLFLGLWLVMMVNGKDHEVKSLRWMVPLWLVVHLGFAVAFVANYAVLPRYDGRYRAVLFPGDRLADEIANRFRAFTGRPLGYVIADMWTGGNVGHYAAEQPRVLIDGDPRRAPWIDLGDLHSKGAVVVWTEGDPTALPRQFQRVAETAEVQAPFALPFRRGPMALVVGWAVLPPQRAVAQSTPRP